MWNLQPKLGSSVREYQIFARKHQAFTAFLWLFCGLERLVSMLADVSYKRVHKLTNLTTRRLKYGSHPRPVSEPQQEPPVIGEHAIRELRAVSDQEIRNEWLRSPDKIQMWRFSELRAGRVQRCLCSSMPS